ncbi:MAG: DsbA family oxidoreductase [Halieaceae bacterium]|nr:DsbA family oxidoreductase [Halieaceae bacterium]
MELKVDIVSDVVCPWCIIGYKQLMLALEQRREHFSVTLRWHPFELNPGMPETGQDFAEHMAMKYGATPASSAQASSRLTALGESLGFTFNDGNGQRMRNTFRAHQLLHWAGLLGQQTALKLALFEAFFTRGEDVNDVSVLVAVAGAVGLDVSEAKAILDDQRFATAVRSEQQAWMDRDVFAVPAFFFNDGYPVPGAQTPDTFLRVLDKLYDKTMSAAS